MDSIGTRQRGPVGHVGLVLAATTLVTLAFAGPAQALVANYDRDGGLVVTARPGENNDVETGFFSEPPFGNLPTNYEVHDKGSPVTASSGCTLSASTANCAITGIRAVRADLGDGNNTYKHFGTADLTVSSKGGVDKLIGASGFDYLSSGAGEDEVRGGDGADLIDAGPDADRIFGDGTGGTGDDRILARDGFADAIDCGPGFDELDSDLKDGKPPASCEKVDQGAIHEAPNVDVLTAQARPTGAGRVLVTLSCPAAARRCAGTLTIGVPGAGSARRSYSIRRARRGRVSVQLGPAARRALARRAKVNARLVSLEQGDDGPKTTVRPLTLVRAAGTARHARVPLAHAAAAGTSATASFVERSGLMITAKPGWRNDVHIQYLSAPARYKVTDNAHGVTAGAGCVTVSVVAVECRAIGPRTIRALLGDRDDKLDFVSDLAGGADAIIDGGESFDRFQGADGYDILFGGPDGGDDDLKGNGGNDVLLGGPGPDRLTGGAGNDRVTGEAGLDDIFLNDGVPDRYCDTDVRLLEIDPEDIAICPA